MKVEIYVKHPVSGRWEILDLFKDESINLNFKLKDLNDISKVFSTYSQDFTIPASGNNRKVFNYFFNTDLVRVRERGLESKIFVNDSLFRTGQISIKEGRVENFKLVDYKVEFRTVIAQLKEKIGDDTLSGSIGDVLNDNYSIQWDSQSVYDRIVWSDGNEDILIPLVSNRRVWTYGDGGVDDIKVPANGIDKFELRPAIKLNRILDLIFDHYDLSIDFPIRSLPLFDNLYVWLNNKSDEEEQPPITYNFEFSQPWTLSPGTNSKVFFDVENSSGGFRITDTGFDYNNERVYNFTHFISGVVSAETGEPYQGKLITTITHRESGQQFVLENLEAGTDIIVNQRISQGLEDEVRTYDISYTFDYPVEAAMVYNISVLWHTTSPHPSNSMFNTNNVLPATFNNFNIKYALGDWKVIDLLSSIFIMFIVSVLEDYDNMSMEWLTPENFFVDNKITDINKYTDIKGYTIKPSTNYKEIQFKHTDEGYFRNVEYKKLVEKEYGSEVYKSEDKALTETYQVETKFSIMNWFLLNGTNLKTSYGFSKPGSPQEPSVPTIMYSEGFNIIRTDDDAMNVDFRFKIPSSGNIGNTNQLARYIKFGNQSEGVQSITFDIDIEPEANKPMIDSLYNRYYKSDIERLYQPNSNYYSFEGYLSTDKIIEFDMRDYLIVEDSVYTIEESSMDITNGKFKAELLNITNFLDTKIRPPKLNVFTAVGGINEISGAMNIIENEVEINTYEIQYRISGAWLVKYVPYTPSVSTVYNITGVPAGMYEVRGRVVSTTGIAGEWTTVSAEVVALPPPLTFTAEGGEQEISGAINSNDIPADHYEIQYRISGSWLSYQLPYVPFQSSIYSITPVTPPGTYQVRARMVGTDSNIFSDWVTAPDVEVT